MANILEQKVLLEGNSGDVNEDNTSINETVVIRFDSDIIDSVEAIQLSGFFIGNSHIDNDFLSIEAISANAFSGREWLFDIAYSSKQTTNNSSSPDEQAYKPIIGHGTWTYQRVVTQDKQTGLDITNKAGEPFDSPIIEEIACPTISVTVRKNSAGMKNIEKIGSINNTAFKLVGIDIPKYCAQLSDYQVNLAFDSDGDSFFENTFVFKLNFNKSKSTGATIGFIAEIANTGFKAKDSEGNLFELKDSNGNEYTVPTFLSEDGSSATESPNYLQFVVNDLENFSSLNLPTRYPQY